MRNNSENKVRVYLGDRYPEPKPDRRQGGGNRRREDRRIVAERRRGQLDLIGPNRLPVERLKAA